jgi:hypothetical protein
MRPEVDVLSVSSSPELVSEEAPPVVPPPDAVVDDRAGVAVVAAVVGGGGAVVGGGAVGAVVGRIVAVGNGATAAGESRPHPASRPSAAIDRMAEPRRVPEWTAPTGRRAHHPR